jgi:hypothetical protein
MVGHHVAPLPLKGINFLTRITQLADEEKRPVNMWIRFEGITIYVRVTQRGLPCATEHLRVPTIDLANMQADQPGEGVLPRALLGIEALAREKERWVYIENVLTERFAAWWERRGYIRIPTRYHNAPGCFVLPPPPRVYTPVDVEPFEPHSDEV